MSEQVMTATAARGLTVEEFWALPEPPVGQRHQLVDGEVVVAASPIPGHQSVGLELAMALRRATVRSGAQVYVAPLDVVLGPRTVVQPDVVVYDADAAARIDPERVIDVLPALVAEVLSPSTARLDTMRKRRRYEQAGIPEYWVVSREDRTIDVLRLDDDRYVDAGSFADGDVVTTPLLPDVAVTVTDVFGT